MAILHAVCWSLVEKAAGWNFGAGAEDSLPRGGAAVALSMTVVFPLFLVPPIYAWLFEVPIVPARHYGAVLAAAMGASLGHLAVYGTNAPRIRGMRELLIRNVPGRELSQEIVVLFLYAFFIVLPIVVPYRLVTHGFRGFDLGYTLTGLLLPPRTVFCGGMTFIVVRYPESIYDKSWIQVRGVIVGFLVMAMIAASVFF